MGNNNNNNNNNNFVSIIIIQCIAVSIINIYGIVGQSDNNNLVNVSVGGARSNFIGFREYIIGDRTNRFYHSFKGIRYAVPPIGNKRWTDPKLLEPIESSYDATQYGEKCKQWSRNINDGGGSVIGDEDCLFLNIFTPVLPSVSDPSRSTSIPLIPVIVYIHGGGFMYGSGQIAGPKKFMKHDVILITLNYRLGVFGYLSTGDKYLPGNYGCLDQIIALDWIQKYIRYFGGNPESVTIFGHSAGAASVHLLTLSPRAQGKFHRAIIQSGSSLCDWAIEPNPKKYINEIGKELGCSSSSSSESLVNCLHEKSSETLIQIQQNKLDFWVLPGHTAPVIDIDSRGVENGFLVKTPEEIMSNENFTSSPIMTGVTMDEGFMGYGFLHLNVTYEKFRNQTYFDNVLIPRVLRDILKKDEIEINIITNAVRQHYFDKINIAEDISHKMAISALNQLFGDVMFYSCHWNMLEKYAIRQINSVYSYVFTHKTITSPKIMGNTIQTLRSQKIHHHLFDHGIPHGEDMFYYFEPMEQLPGNREEKMNPIDEKVSDIVTRIWVGFAKHGSPASGILPGYYPWRPIKTDTINYYNLTSIPAPMGLDFKKGESLFWLRTIPHLIELGKRIKNLETYPLLFWIFFGISILLFVISICLGIILWRKRSTGKALH